MTLNRRTFGTAIGAALMAPAFARIVGAQPAYPTKPVTIIVPFDAGGPIDVITRYVGEKLSTILGQRVLVENKSGAAGAIGLEYMIRAPKDGYTLVATSANDIATMKAVRGSTLSFDPVEDPYPVARLFQRPYVLYASVASGFKTVQDLIDAAKADPGGLSYSSSGQGGHSHLITEQFNRMTGIEAVQISYKGSGPATQAVVTEEVDFTFGSPSQYPQFAENGQITALGVTSATAFSLLPQLPTIAETVPGFTSTASVDVMVARGVPDDIMLTINAAFAQLLKDPEVITRINQAGEVYTATPAELDADLKAQYVGLEKIVKELNLTP